MLLNKSRVQYDWQVLENNYAKGFESIGFEIRDSEFFALYKEKDEEYSFEIGFGDDRVSCVDVIVRVRFSYICTMS